MKVLFAADGSTFTKKALAFLVTHESFVGAGNELVVLNVQPPVTGLVTKMIGSAEVAAYHDEEAAKVLDPIKKFLDHHPIKYSCSMVVGRISDEILLAAKNEKAHMLVMGTRGHGLITRALMGSVAQRVLADSDIPVLLVQ